MIQRKMIQRKKTTKKHSKGRKSQRHSTRGKTQRRSMRSTQRGGDTGRYALPGAYFGNGTKGYSETGGFSKGSKQMAVSDGTIHPSGSFAGPNLYPQQVGSGCGCSGKKKTSYKSTSHKHSKYHQRK